jgi:hypothetical protein
LSVAILDKAQALSFYRRLPRRRQIATLSPDYVCADAYRQNNLHPIFFLFEDNRGFWLHGAHLSNIHKTQCNDLQSAYGYGGPVSTCDETDFHKDAWHSYLATCQELNIVVEFVRLHPVADWQVYLGTIVCDRQTVIVDLSNSEWRQAYQGRCRTALRKAEKHGLEFVELPACQIKETFCPFYRNAMKALYAENFYLFPARYFEAVAALKEVRLFACIYENRWLAAGMFLRGGDCMEYHLSAATAEGRQYSATNLLIDGAAEKAAMEGLKTLYLGGGTDASSKNSLLQFKTSFSPNKTIYKYGYHIHQPAFYKSLRSQSNEKTDRILFYRSF